jgi:hypothetical protein
MRSLLTACALLSLSGCLEPGDPLLAVRDTDPPEVESTNIEADGTIASDATLEITFSEFMDVRTLRPGIAVFSGGSNEVALSITVPPPTEGDEDVERGDLPYTVMVNAEAGAFTANTSYTLVLRTALTDYEGNALTEEVRVPFRTRF